MAFPQKDSATPNQPDDINPQSAQSNAQSVTPLTGFLGLLDELGIVTPQTPEAPPLPPSHSLPALPALSSPEQSPSATGTPEKPPAATRNTTTIAADRTPASTSPLDSSIESEPPSPALPTSVPSRPKQQKQSNLPMPPSLEEQRKAQAPAETATANVEALPKTVPDPLVASQKLQKKPRPSQVKNPSQETNRLQKIPDTTNDSFKQLQALIMGPELTQQRQQAETLTQKLAELERQIAQLSTLVGPGLSEQEQVETLTQKLIALEQQLNDVAHLVGPGLSQGKQQVTTLTQNVAELEQQLSRLEKRVGPDLNPEQPQLETAQQKFPTFNPEQQPVDTAQPNRDDFTPDPQPAAPLTQKLASLDRQLAELSALIGSELSDSEQVETLTNKILTLEQQLANLARLIGPGLSQGQQQVETLTQKLVDLETQLAEVSRLAGMEAQELQPQLEILARKLASLNHQLTDSQASVEWLLPLIVEVLQRKVASSKQEVCQVLAPIIDEIIEGKIQLDKVAMSEALAPIIAEAIARHMRESPQDVGRSIGPEMAVAIREQIRLDRDAIASALGPEMGKAIQEQVRLERDAMVDALYPVIGNTITKYLKEAIRAINERVENALSPAGISRKIRARVQGVSEAELILQESIPFSIQAIFLIHKASGLVIAENQQSASQPLEADMIAGMLTAIRSFASDCIVQPGEVSELGEIDYDKYKIVMEVAGYCYLAAIIEGEPSKQFILNFRQTLGQLIQQHAKSIKSFDGDPDSVPTSIHRSLEQLRDSASETKKRKPVILPLIGIGLLSLALIPFGFYLFNRRIETIAKKALSTDPALAVYQLNVNAYRNQLELNGKLPSLYLKHRAEQLAQKAAPNRTLKNNIISVEVPPDPTMTAAEVERVTDILNQMEGVTIVSQYQAGKVMVEGTIAQPAKAEHITQAFDRIPGVESVVNTAQLQQLTLATRIYFDVGSTQIAPLDMEIKIIPIKRFLHQYPETHLRIIGHADPSGNDGENQQLALKRAKTVKTALSTQGIDPSRIEVSGTLELPPGVAPKRSLWLSRCTRFEPVTPVMERK